MDLRKQKTRQAIRQAFLQMRKEKNLEQITVKELSELAQVSKATFYLHYRDIYDLSEQLQQEAIQKVLSYVKSPLAILEDRSQFSREMAFALEKEDAVISALFAGAQASALPISLEKQIKNCIFAEYPQLKDDARLNVQLSYHIQGGYYAYMENVRALGKKRVQELIDQIHGQMPIVIGK